MARQYAVTALGELLIDFVPHGKDDNGDLVFAAKTGGAPPNLLCAVSSAGFRSGMIGMVGNDMFGRQILREIVKYGVDVSNVKVSSSYNTTLAFVSLDETGDRDFSFFREHNADTHLSKDDFDPEMIRQSDIFHFGSLSFTHKKAREATEEAIRIASESGCIISYDPNYRAPLWKCEKDAVDVMDMNIRRTDILKISLEEAQMVTGEEDAFLCMEKIFGMGPKLILVTDGGNGIRYGIRGETGEAHAYKMNTIDTTGAGDIFFGSFLAGFLKSGKSFEEITAEDVGKFVDRAAYIAAVSTTRHGGIASIPVEELQKL
ncbi:MAG: carbohydrate kinase [Lachnospiraceae bacterium]|nr:carbohydrate kinase [Lachnospiraceae bacterium]MBQ7582377.1 carbohydrate kinase [Lachnospiraceae bacterium]